LGATNLFANEHHRTPRGVGSTHFVKSKKKAMTQRSRNIITAMVATILAMCVALLGDNMLWTDSSVVTTADLASVDPEISSVATAEGIVIDGQSGIVQRTYESASQQILAQMQRFGGYLSSGLVSANHLAAVFNVGGPGVNRTRIQLGQIVAYDPYFPIVQTWFTYKVLRQFYHAAFSRTLTDRYEKKMNQYDKNIRLEHWPNLKNVGLPIVYRPMCAPGAINERVPGTTRTQSGTWSASNVSTAVLLGTTGGSFDVAVTYVDKSLYKSQLIKYNAESYTSARITQTVAADHVVTVDITSLVPPNAGSDPAMLPQAIATPLNADGWNLWIGVTGGILYLQNPQPYAITQKTATLTADPVMSGFQSDYGQFADAFYTVQDLIQRG
jgi:hypothetical protein